MFAEDRVLVGVINRKRDLSYARDQHWYRIPVERIKRERIDTEYVAFFLSGRVFQELSGTIPYYARIKGLELVHRRDILPTEADHPRADEQYYRLALDDLIQKPQPITNPARRPISFIYTTWDRFIVARTIADLYSDADHFVARIQSKLTQSGVVSEQIWQAEYAVDEIAPGLRISHLEDIMNQGADEETSFTVPLDPADGEDRILAAIFNEIAKADAPMTINFSFDRAFFKR